MLWRVISIAEKEREVDEVQIRIEEIISGIRNIRRPFRERRRKIVDALLSSLEKRAYERRRNFYNLGEEETQLKLKREIAD